MRLHLFTPRLSYGSLERRPMQLSDEDIAKIQRGYRWQATVTDRTVGGKKYVVRGASCGVPRCMCDAVIIKEVV